METVKTMYGDSNHENVTHIFYMGDHKIYAVSNQRLGVDMWVLEDITSDIGMELDKYWSIQLLES